MNRIILIGNGFDLAHGLPTSYNDFITDYCTKWRKRLRTSVRKREEDGLCKFLLDYDSLPLSWKIGQHLDREFPELIKSLLNVNKLLICQP